VAYVRRSSRCPKFFWGYCTKYNPLSNAVRSLKAKSRIFLRQSSRSQKPQLSPFVITRARSSNLEHTPIRHRHRKLFTSRPLPLPLIAPVNTRFHHLPPHLPPLRPLHPPTNPQRRRHSRTIDFHHGHPPTNDHLPNPHIAIRTRVAAQAESTPAGLAACRWAGGAARKRGGEVVGVNAAGDVGCGG